MVPNKFNIVEFGGFDLAGQYGEALPGIYDKIVDAHWNCVYIMCFGLKFGGFEIAPQYMTPEMFSDHIMLNGIISIDRNDVITIPSIVPPPPTPVIQPLTVTENRVYEVPSGVAGFNPVTGQVPIPAPEYEEIQPDFFGLSYGFVDANGAFSAYTTQTNTLWVSEVESGVDYIVLSPETSGGRFRAAFFAGKESSDFSYGIENPGSGVIYTGTLITGVDGSCGYYTPASNGVIAILTSANSVLASPLVLKVN